MANSFLALGSNLGAVEQNMNAAIEIIGSRCGLVISVSKFYETIPFGFISDNNFLNSVIEIDTTLTPQELLVKTKMIEIEIGREKKSIDGEYQDRLIDIDILTYDNISIESNELIIPHPKFAERLFVLEPWAEIAPYYIPTGYTENIESFKNRLIADNQ